MFQVYTFGILHIAGNKIFAKIPYFFFSDIFKEIKQYGTIPNQVLFCFYFGLFVYWTYYQPNSSKIVLLFILHETLT